MMMLVGVVVVVHVLFFLEVIGSVTPSLRMPVESTFLRPSNLDPGRERDRSPHARMPMDERIRLREQVRAAFHHGFDSYLTHAFPLEELRPLSCRGRGSADGGQNRGHLDDVFGGYPLTLVDSMDTLAVMGEYGKFGDALQLVRRTVRFDRNTTVSVFETTIRTLGGLLSSHQLAVRAVERGLLPVYSGFLLPLAEDLGLRLLPAFESSTGIPFSRVNLLTGVPDAERKEAVQCPAGAGTLALEFGTLSALTGNPAFWNAVRRGMDGLYERRSNSDLFGGLISVSSGTWLNNKASIGAGSDSFFEYLFKAYVLSGDRDLLRMFNRVYAAIERHLRTEAGWYLEAKQGNGAPLTRKSESLAAFWPALQVLVGDVSDAEDTFDNFARLWRVFGFLPESVGVDPVGNLRLLGGSYPLRPELLESAYALFTATGDHDYLHFGREMLASIERTRVPCGYAAVADVQKGRLEDRLDSFFFSETLKYLYLLFDPNTTHPLLGKNAADAVFTTEGHPLLLSTPEMRAWRLSLDRNGDDANSTARVPLPQSQGYSGRVSKKCPCGCGSRDRSGRESAVELAQRFSHSFTGAGLESHSHSVCPAAESVVTDAAVDISFALLASLGRNQTPVWHWSSRRLLRKLRRNYQRKVHFNDSSEGDPVRSGDPSVSLVLPETPVKLHQVNVIFTPTASKTLDVHFFAYNQTLGIASGSPAAFGVQLPIDHKLCGPIMFLGPLCRVPEVDVCVPRPWMNGFIGLVERGSCLFADKAANLGQFRASAMVIENNDESVFTMTAAPADLNVNAVRMISCMVPSLPHVVRQFATHACIVHQPLTNGEQARPTLGGGEKPYHVHVVSESGISFDPQQLEILIGQVESQLQPMLKGNFAQFHVSVSVLPVN